MSPRSTTETLDVPWYVVVAFAVVGVIATVTAFSTPDVARSVAPIGIFIGDGVAGYTFIRRSRSLTGREKRSWTLVGIGLATATSGIAVVGVQSLIDADPPTFGASDVCFIVGYMTMIVGIASLPHTEGDRMQRARIALDGVIGAVSIGALAWVFVLDPIIAGLGDAPLTDQVFGTLYPLVDVAVIVVVMIVTIRRSAFQFDVRLFLLMVAIALQAIADVSYLVSGAGKSFAESEPLFLAYLGAAALFLTTALVVDRVPKPREFADRHIPLWSMVVPYSAAAVMVGVLIFHLWDTSVDDSDRVLLVASIVVALAVVARQAISIRDMRATVERERSDLVSSISHELRTPLTSTVGFVAILQEDPKLDLSERIEMIDVVMEQTKQLERTVQDLLLLAHDESSDMTLATAEWRIEPLVENAILAATVGRVGVATEIQPGLSAFVDADRLQQILVNLLRNAVAYGGDSCLVVARGDHSQLVIEIHDSGPGVPKKYELSIWDRFERGPNRYNSAIPGTGIGLAMVKTITLAHGGRATYRTSERLGGACFAVEFPGRVSVTKPTAIVPSSTMAIG